jgi:hypothetical protein
VTSRVVRVDVIGADPVVWAGLIGYLPFNEGFAEESVWRHPVLQRGATLIADRRGRTNSAAAFNGAGDFVEIPNHAALEATNYTVALWFNPARRAGLSGGAGAETLFSRGAGGMDLQLGIPSEGGGIRFRPLGRDAWDTSGGTFTTNRWQHLVAVYDAAAGLARLYVDGVLRPTAGAGAVLPELTTGPNGLRFGVRHGDGNPFQGRLDDVRVYARALGQREVQTLLEAEAAAPLILNQPESLRLAEGSAAMLSVGLVGERPLAFAWTQAGSDKVVRSETLNFGILGREHAGMYKVVVTNFYGVATSRAVLVDVLYRPEFVLEPTDKAVTVGSTVRLSAGVTGNPEPSMQWYRDGTVLPGATNALLLLSSVQAGDSGAYSLVASNEVGVVTGRQVRVSVSYPPVITKHPESLSVDHGLTFELSVEATGLPAPRYQWLFGGAEIPGETNALFRVANATIRDEGMYHVVVYNALGTVQSDGAMVRVRRFLPSVTGLPDRREVSEGGDLVLEATVSSLPIAQLQWLHDGQRLPSETNAVLRIVGARLGEAGRYGLVATNLVGGVTNEVGVGVKPSGQSLGLALDTALDLAWGFPTASGWHYQTEHSHDGEDAARSGRIGGYQATEMRLPLRGPGTLTFWWASSCEEEWDFAEVLLDGRRKGRITGIRNWIPVRVDVPEGVHTVTWRYTKDGNTDDGVDAAWVDEVQWNPAEANVSQDWIEVLPFLDGGLQVRAMGGRPGRIVIQSSEDLETWVDHVSGISTNGVLRSRVNSGQRSLYFRSRSGIAN